MKAATPRDERVKGYVPTKGDNSWFVCEGGGFEVRWVQTEAEYDRGEALFNSFASGEKVAEAPVETTETAPDDGTM